MASTYSELYSGDGNPAKKTGVGDKISKTKKGIPSKANKLALRKPKSKTDKIKEAANRPEERERRSLLMANRLIGGYRLSGTNETVTTIKSNCPILCRSKLEAKFLRKLDDFDKVLSVESAEKLKLPYIFEGAYHHYLPDFKIKMIDGKIIIIEIKGSHREFDEATLIKQSVLRSYCEKNNFKEFLLTERTMHIWLETLR